MKKNYLQLINANYPIKDEDRPKYLVKAPFSTSEKLLDPVVATNFYKLVTQNRLLGKLVVIDAFRKKETQQQIWDETLKKEGEKFTKQYVAKPGCSEHELGLAIDVGLADRDNNYIRPFFEKGPVVATFLKEMGHFGFILRYPKGKEDITGISYEPWHFRYVGTPHSRIMIHEGWVLEEYIMFLKEVRGNLNEY